MITLLALMPYAGLFELEEDNFIQIVILALIIASSLACS